MSIRPVNQTLNNLAVVVVGISLTAGNLVISSPVRALTLITDRSRLRANERLDFSSLGKVYNPLAPSTTPDSFLPNTFSATSDKGLELNLDIPTSNDPDSTPPFIFQTTSLPVGIPTNFADGDFLLFTGADLSLFPSPGNPGPLTIDFVTPVTGAGTQIAVDDTPSFTAFLSAFDDEKNLLGSFSRPGTSSGALDNSALFLGVISESANIARLVYSTNASNRAIGINTVSISTRTIPEPAALFGLLLVATSGIFWRGSKEISSWGRVSRRDPTD